VVNYFTFLAEEVREVMAGLGVRSLDELIGRTDLLEMNEAIKHWKSQGLDYSKLLARPQPAAGVGTRCSVAQDHGIDKVLDRQLIEKAMPALERREAVRWTQRIRNSDRTCGAMLSGEVARRHGRDGLPEGTIRIDFEGVAGQSFGAFLAPGLDFQLTGDANDYVGKGMAGGRIVVRPPPGSSFKWDENSIVGNTVLYGATGGECYFAGCAGERFAVRNSGCKTVIEGTGDHGCEYMTGGLVVVLGRTGRNFAAGMSGGFAFVLDAERKFASRCNTGMVDLEQVTPQTEGLDEIKRLIATHAELTGSPVAKVLLTDWNQALKRFVKVFPHEYRRVLQERAAKAATGKLVKA
jgi:glutamate synthase domain-containing protein 3